MDAYRKEWKMLPEGIKVLNEWLDASGGRQMVTAKIKAGIREVDL